MRFETEIDLEVEMVDSLEQISLIWNLEIETCKSGVESFCVTIPRQTLNYSIAKMQKLKTGEMDEVEVKKTLLLEPDEIRFMFDKPEARSYSGLGPVRLEVWKGKLTLFFEL